MVELTPEMQEIMIDVQRYQVTQRILLVLEHLFHTKLMRFSSRGEMIEKQSEQSQKHTWRDALFLLSSCSVLSNILHPMDCSTSVFPVLHYLL